MIPTHPLKSLVDSIDQPHQLGFLAYWSSNLLEIENLLIDPLHKLFYEHHSLENLRQNGT